MPIVLISDDTMPTIVPISGAPSSLMIVSRKTSSSDLCYLCVGRGEASALGGIKGHVDGEHLVVRKHGSTLVVLDSSRSWLVVWSSLAFCEPLCKEEEGSTESNSEFSRAVEKVRSALKAAERPKSRIEPIWTCSRLTRLSDVLVVGDRILCMSPTNLHVLAVKDGSVSFLSTIPCPGDSFTHMFAYSGTVYSLSLGIGTSHVLRISSSGEIAAECTLAAIPETALIVPLRQGILAISGGVANVLHVLGLGARGQEYGLRIVRQPLPLLINASEHIVSCELLETAKGIFALTVVKNGSCTLTQTAAYSGQFREPETLCSGTEPVSFVTCAGVIRNTFDPPKVILGFRSGRISVFELPTNLNLSSRSSLGTEIQVSEFPILRIMQCEGMTTTTASVCTTTGESRSCVVAGPHLQGSPCVAVLDITSSLYVVDLASSEITHRICLSQDPDQSFEVLQLDEDSMTVHLHGPGVVERWMRDADNFYLADITRNDVQDPIDSQTADRTVRSNSGHVTQISLPPILTLSFARAVPPEVAFLVSLGKDRMSIEYWVHPTTRVAGELDLASGLMDRLVGASRESPLLNTLKALHSSDPFENCSDLNVALLCSLVESGRTESTLRKRAFDLLCRLSVGVKPTDGPWITLCNVACGFRTPPSIRVVLVIESLLSCPAEDGSYEPPARSNAPPIPRDDSDDLEFRLYVAAKVLPSLLLSDPSALDVAFTLLTNLWSRPMDRSTRSQFLLCFALVSSLFPRAFMDSIERLNESGAPWASMLMIFLRRCPLAVVRNLDRIVKLLVQAVGNPTGKRRKKFVNNMASITHTMGNYYPMFCFNQKTQRLFVGQVSGDLTVYDLSNASLFATVAKWHAFPITALSVNEEGRVLVTYSAAERKVRVSLVTDISPAYAIIGGLVGNSPINPLEILSNRSHNIRLTDVIELPALPEYNSICHELGSYAQAATSAFPPLCLQIPPKSTKILWISSKEILVIREYGEPVTIHNDVGIS